MNNTEVKVINRESGFYWVRFLESSWTIGLWSEKEKVWRVIYGSDFHYDDEFEEITQKPISKPNNSKWK